MEREGNMALIIIDVQNDFCPGGALAVTEGDEVILVINKLLTKSDEFSLIICSQDWHPEKHCSFIENGGVWPKHCVAYTKGAELRKDLDLSSVSIWYYVRKGKDPNKEAYSAFEGPQLESALKDWKIEKIFICGLATDYCVKATALDAKKAGFKTYVILDACRGVNAKKGDVGRAVKKMRKAGIKIISSKEV